MMSTLPQAVSAAPSDDRSFVHRMGALIAMIKFSHTIFALPFALLSMLLAAGGLPEFRTFFWIVVACVCARSAAMAFNRLHDEPYDKLNPRTKGWALPSGALGRAFVLKFCIACAAGFVFASWQLNRLTFILSPLALIVLIGYSTTKRYTALAHFVLGLALAIAPVGAWIAVTGEFALTPIALGMAVLFWVAGFDIIYSCQDVEVDRKLKLHSLPARMGRSRALALSAICHLASIVLFLVFWMTSELLGGSFLLGVAVCALLLAYEQSLVSPGDLSKVNQAFFTMNGWVSVALFVSALSDILM